MSTDTQGNFSLADLTLCSQLESNILINNQSALGLLHGNALDPRPEESEFPWISDEIPLSQIALKNTQTNDQTALVLLHANAQPPNPEESEFPCISNDSYWF